MLFSTFTKIEKQHFFIYFQYKFNYIQISFSDSRLYDCRLFKYPFLTYIRMKLNLKIMTEITLLAVYFQEYFHRFFHKKLLLFYQVGFKDLDTNIT